MPQCQALRKEKFSVNSQHLHINVRLGFMLILLLPVLLASNGCNDYPKVGFAAFELAKSLHTICDMQKKEQLAEFESVVKEQLAAGELSQHEEKVLMDIVSTAHQGDWNEAKQQARQLLLAQNSQ